MIDRLFLVTVQVVPIHKTSGSKRPKGISKAIEEYVYVHSKLSPSR